MKTEQFLNLLTVHPNNGLLFEYAPDKLVGANYHITEVKYITVDSVNCGGQTDSSKEAIIELWESPMKISKIEHTSAYKAFGILKKVSTIKSYTLDTQVKFEYSNNTFHTAQLFVNDVELKDDYFIIKLAVEKTDCKAKDICGIAETFISTKTELCYSPDGNCY
jgi:hypothetical protein